MQEPVVRAVHVSKCYGARRALDDVSVELFPGSVTGLIGANGAGKTTLMRILTRLLRPDSGAVRHAIDARGIGYLPEERGLYLRQSPLQTLRFLAELRGMRTAEADACARRWLGVVSMPDDGSRRLEQYSKGQQQKAQLAAAFLGDPALIVLDEPFAGLDPLNARLVIAVVNAARDRGAAVMVSAHQLNLLAIACDHVVMLDRGKVVVSEKWQRSGRRRLEDLFMEQSGVSRSGS